MELVLPVAALAASIWAVVRTARMDALASLVFIPAIASSCLAVIMAAWGPEAASAIEPGPGQSVMLAADSLTGVQLFSIAAIAQTLGPLIVYGNHRWVVGRYEAPALSRPWMTALGCALTAAFVFIYGVQNLISRMQYIPPFSIPQLSSYTSILLPTAVFLLSYVSTGRSKDRSSLVAWSVLAVIWLIQFSTASRSLALMPVIWLAAWIVAGRKITVRIIIGVVLAMTLGANIALSLRSASQGHGLIAYVEQMFIQPPSLLGDGVMEVLVNILFAVPLAAYVSQTGLFSWFELGVSVNPSLGPDAGWGEISDGLRVHLFIPFNAIGELSSIGYWLLAVFMIFLSALVAVAARVTIADRQRAVAGMSMVLYLMIYVLMLQYNLRSSMRLVYVLPVLIIAALYFSRRKRRLALVSNSS